MNKVIHILLGAAVLLAITLIYFVLLRPGQATLSHSQWLLFGGASLALVLVAFLPSIVRRIRGLPPQPVPPSDLRFAIILVAVICSLMPLLGEFGYLLIMVVPFAFIIRGQLRGQPNSK